MLRRVTDLLALLDEVNKNFWSSFPKTIFSIKFHITTTKHIGEIVVAVMGSEAGNFKLLATIEKVIGRGFVSSSTHQIEQYIDRFLSRSGLNTTLYLTGGSTQN
jgi:hypothetical protein